MYVLQKKKVLNNDDSLGRPISIPSRGVAHANCAEEDLIEKRIFGSFHITEISLEDLYELRELVKSEIECACSKNTSAYKNKNETSIKCRR